MHIVCSDLEGIFFPEIWINVAEKTGIEELETLGATDLKAAYRGVYFIADRKAIYTINYTSRLITRVLAPLYSFKCESTKHLYKILTTLKDFFPIQSSCFLIA